MVIKAVKDIVKELIFSVPFGRVAVVPVNVAIFMRNVDPYIRLLKFVEKNPLLKGLLLVINSPGGDAGASELFYSEVKRLSDKKPVYAYALFAASGGYMVACGAHKILMPRTGVVGSIGVIYSRFILKDLLSRAGVKVDIYKKGKHKDLFMFHREASPEEKKKLNILLEETYSAFLDIVSTERRISKEKLKKIATGEMFGAKTAVKLKLADDICSYADAIAKLTDEVGLKPDQYIVIHPPRPLIARFMYTAVESFSEALFERALRSQF